MATDHEDQLKQYVPSQEVPGTPDVRPYYSKVGDFVSFCWSPGESFFTRRVDEFTTIYDSMKTKKVVGCKMKGVGYLIEQARQMIADGKNRLTIKSISIVARGLAKKPAIRSEYEDVWQNGDAAEIEDPRLQPASQ